MYERFTDRARKVMWLADEEAQRLGASSLATEHILLGLLKEGSGVGANVLRGFDVDFKAILLAVEATTPKIPDASAPRVTQARRPWWHMASAGRRLMCPHELPLSAQSKSVIESAMLQARSLDHNYVGTEHLLLGLLHQPDTVAARLLTAQGLKLDDVRRETLNLLGRNS
jgi:ATP-dependent Clp protease ATP-binding subunit ClpC